VRTGLEILHGAEDLKVVEFLSPSWDIVVFLQYLEDVWCLPAVAELFYVCVFLAFYHADGDGTHKPVTFVHIFGM